MKRRAPLPRSRKRIARRSRPRAKGKPRFKVSGQRDEAYRAWVRGQPCCVSGVRRGELAQHTYDRDFTGWTNRVVYAVIEPDHVRARGAGGRDHGDLVPLEARLHAERHTIGIRSFEKKYGVDLKAKAAETWARYQAQRAGVPPEDSP